MTSGNRLAELPFGMESRDEAVNYFDWQAESFFSLLQNKDSLVVDLGAGTGGLAGGLLRQGAQRIIALEPESALIDVLRTKFQGNKHVEVRQGVLEDVLRERGPRSVDCIVSSNVLEHIDDDIGCLETAFELLRPGGRLGLYLPARPELFGSLDRAVGHFRRYRLSELKSKLSRTGFVGTEGSYRNVIGVLPWLWSGRVMNKASLGHGSVRVFDRYIFPVSRWVEDRLKMPYGLNVIVTAIKPS